VAKNVLIVEDDPDVAAALAEVLEAAGFCPVVASNGREALDRLKQHAWPSVILLDMMMPVMDGWAFRREQERMSGAAAIPIVVLTADGGAREKAAALRAHGHLSKPVSIDALLREVERVGGSPDESE
jgi:CheY-like chemotaxis protein